MKINENMNIFTIRKKILLASKLIGVALIVSYILSTKPVSYTHLACKNMRVLYLLRSGEYMPLQVNLPPTSIKPFKEFLNRAFMLRRRATYGSIVQIGLKRENNGTNDYSVATFKLLQDFQGEELAQIRTYANSFKEQIKLLLQQRAEITEEQRLSLIHILSLIFMANAWSSAANVSCENSWKFSSASLTRPM